jgi:hypothetical protein
VAASDDKGTLLHAVNHFAKRAAIDPDVSRELRKRERALLMQCQQHAELTWGNFSLCRQSLVFRARKPIPLPSSSVLATLSGE